MPHTLRKRGLERLEGVHKDLAKVIKAAIEISRVDLTVLERLRDIERQREVFRTGA